MTQESFVNRRLELWDRIEMTINGGRKKIRSEAAWFPRAFRELIQDLNTARAHGFDPAVIDRINRLVLEGNQVLYGQRSFSLRALADFLVVTFPRAVRSQWKAIAAAHILFYGLAIFTGVLCARDQPAVFDFLPEAQVDSLEQMYDPGSAHYLKESGVTTSADMFGFYIYNNISIAFRTFAGGILAGVGSLFFLCYNAVFLGAAAGHLVAKGFAHTFFPFVVAHGAFELTAIVLSACAGLILGASLFITRGRSRAASLKVAAKTAVPIVAGSALFLVAAASLEAFWSSRHALPLALRYGVGLFCWLLVIAYLALSGREGRR